MGLGGDLIYVSAATKSKVVDGRTINRGWKLYDPSGDFKKVEEKGLEGSLGIVFQLLMG